MDNAGGTSEFGTGTIRYLSVSLSRHSLQSRPRSVFYSLSKTGNEISNQKNVRGPRKDDIGALVPGIRLLNSLSLAPSSVLPSQFRLWFASAQSNPSIPEPEAISLATSTPSGAWSVRPVLLKSVDTRGFMFFTNYGSRKADELESNGRAAMAVYWGAVHRQVRVFRRVEREEKERGVLRK